MAVSTPIPLSASRATAGPLQVPNTGFIAAPWSGAADGSVVDHARGAP
jgi:hypothetical protein